MVSSINNVDEYIHSFPENTQVLLNQIRSIIKQTVPEAIESFNYGMPAYKLKSKPMVYFGAYPKHIGFYATPSGHIEFAEELSKYKQGKGSVQFPLDKPIPYDLIARIAKFRAEMILNNTTI